MTRVRARARVRVFYPFQLITSDSEKASNEILKSTGFLTCKIPYLFGTGFLTRKIPYFYKQFFKKYGILNASR